MATFNVIKFRRETKKARNSLRNIAYNAASTKFRAIKNDLLEAFEDEEVTREIEAGVDGSNISSTLNGKGNLFSFIGFDKEQKPLETIRNILKSFEMDKTPVIQDSGARTLFKFEVKLPSLESIHRANPLPWDTGKSWTKGIEKGISGFGHYMYWKKNLPNPPSRSSAGVQVDSLLRGGAFSPRPYLSKIINDFKKELR